LRRLQKEDDAVTTLITPPSSWDFAIRIHCMAPQEIPFFDFARALPSRQPAQLLAFADPHDRVKASSFFERNGARLLPVDVATMRRHGWQPEYARLHQVYYGKVMREIDLYDWSAFCCGLLAEEVAAWVRLFERNPQSYCTSAKPEFTVMMCPYGTTYLVTVSADEGVFIEILGAKSLGADESFGEVISEVAQKNLRFALALLRRRIREHAAAHAKAAAALGDRRK
jgi:hypothetical protein